MANYSANFGEFQVNTYITNSQGWSSVAALSDGGFVVTWSSSGQDGDGSGVYGQRYNANGYRVGSEVQINTYITDAQGAPTITALNDGGFLVSWTSIGQDGSGYGIYGQRYNAGGNQVGNEFEVNTWTTANQGFSSVTALNNGGFVVTWQSDGQDGSFSGVYGQRYNTSGSRVGSEFQVNWGAYATGSQNEPSMTALSDGGFVVTWESNAMENSSWGVYGERYNANGDRVGSEFHVNTCTTSTQSDASVAALNNGGFIVTWTSDGQDGSSSGIYGQRYSANGNLAGSEFRVNSYITGVQDFSSVAALSNGGFVVTWQSDRESDSSYGIFGQRYNANGNPVGNEFHINTYTTSYQAIPSVAALNDGGFVVTWTSDGQDGSRTGIYGQRFRADGTPWRDFAGTSAADTWTGGAGNDRLNGLAANDALFGEAGNDTINGGAGNDTMQGGLGNDTFYVDAGGDVIYEAANAGIDTVCSSISHTLGLNQEKLTLLGATASNGTGNALNNTLTGNAAANTLDGQDGNDTLLGKAGNDILVGRFGNDTLSGGANNDFLFGRDGNDTLTGGSGADTFIFDCTLNAATNRDTISDFSHVSDTIRLDKTVFSKFTVGTLLSSQFRASASGAALDRNDFFLYNTSTGALLYDADGSGAGASIQFATLSNTPQNLSYNDFVVVA